MTLPEVVELYRSQHLDFIYSSNLVRPTQLVQTDPPVGPALERLNTVLTSFGLSMNYTKLANTWLIIRPGSKSRSFEGYVKTSIGMTPVKGAALYLDTAKKAVSSNEDGYFNFGLVPIGSHLLKIDHPNYQSIRNRIELSSRTTAKTYLLENELQIEEVVVSASRYSLRKRFMHSQHTFDKSELDVLPTLGEDPLRIVNHLPGAASLGFSARPHIRGGSKDELLILFNGVELFEPFHLKDFQSLFSGLNPSLIDSIEVFTGGFPARYGNKMSGVMDITTINDRSSFGAELGLSLFATSALTYGAFSENRGRWSASARRGNLDLITQWLNPDVGEPSYSDYMGQINYALSPDTELEIGTLHFLDDIELNDLDEGIGSVASAKYKNSYVWLQLKHNLNEQISSNSILSFGKIHNKRNGFTNEIDPDESVGSVADSQEFSVLRLTQRFEMDVSRRSYLEFGGGIEILHGDYAYSSQAIRGELATLLGLDRQINYDVNLEPQGLVGNLFITHRYALTKQFVIESGLRWDTQDYFIGGLEQQLSPRLNLRYTLATNTSIRLNLGRFYQAQSIHELQVEDGIQRFQKDQYADHLILGFDHLSQNGIGVRLEAYSKNIKNPKTRYENLFNPLVLIPELSPDRVEVNASKARARGFEATISYRPHERLNSWLNYSISHAEDKIGGQWSPRNWDQRHTLSGGVVFRKNAWTMSALVTWNSGWQNTELPRFVTDLETPITLERNHSDLPEYFSLDVRVEREWVWPKQSLKLYLEITNATDHRNVGALEYEIDASSGGGYTVTGNEESMLPFIPSIGLVWQLN